jgi:cell division ATPase FtsA
MVGRFVGPVGLADVDVLVSVVAATGRVVDVEEVEVEVDVAEDREVVEADDTETVVEEDVESVDEETGEADERLVDVENETTELDDAAGGIESRPGVYFVRS